jgi:hypothetical protein
MSGLYVLGAKQRNLLLRREEEWNLYEKALILHLDTESGKVTTCFEYRSPVEARASENSSMVFKSGTLVGDLLYACTSTEVMIFRLPQFQLLHYISLPCFNDLHHVAPGSDGSLIVAVTGLDMVAKITLEGELKAEWSVLGEDLWSRFSRTTDYRKIESTKPHKSHPNFVFELDSRIWVTRFRQRDAVCLDDLSLRIDIGAQFPHDGLVWCGGIYFTSVDGRIVIANPESLQVERTIDLNVVDGQQALLGWCRGVLPLEGNKMWVAFTRIRKTRFQENVLWVKHALRAGIHEKPTHVALYDITGMRRLQEFDLEAHGMNTIFSVFPASTPHVSL